MNYSDYVSQQVLSPLSNQGECSGMGNQTHKILVECLREQQMTTLRDMPLHSTEFLLQKQNDYCEPYLESYDSQKLYVA